MSLAYSLFLSFFGNVPYLNRFISADTIVPNSANPQSFNRYSYVLNRPLVFTDPTGHRPSDGCAYEGCTLVNGFNPYSTWQAPDGTQTPWDPITADAQDYNPITEAVIPGTVGLFGIAALPTAVGYFAGEVAWPALAKMGSAITSWLCLDGDCMNEARVTYDYSLKAGNGETDLLGNIRISPLGSALDRAQALYHEQVHAFFTPRGAFQAIRARLSMGAYNNSHLLRYSEEAIAESVAQLRTGGSLWTGLTFPITNGYVEPAQVALEGGLATGVTIWSGVKLGNVLESWFNLDVEPSPSGN